MTRGRRKKLRAYYIRYDSVDAAASAAAVLWFMVMLPLSWSLNKIPFALAIQRSIIGATFLYLLVSVLLVIVIRTAIGASGHRKKETEAAVVRQVSIPDLSRREAG
ncbi:MAG: hypothetical protein C4520_10570 [Candidatus Abyssobacteria bacterium SURF_5]|uniref:Uncharacterized protein n=1 Tax=Abyssobacteria bacterium (strain SURF_5) TaxID=2093360 RepID=A0A3A4NJS7_ABYX5|nr:MAG: hypothetical protein C4520_10570 [Candidatus Abyssubacteria bacterium SURF_5]